MRDRAILLSAISLILIPFQNCSSQFESDSGADSSAMASSLDSLDRPPPSATPTPPPASTPSPTPSPSPTATPATVESRCERDGNLIRCYSRDGNVVVRDLEKRAGPLFSEVANNVARTICFLNTKAPFEKKISGLPIEWFCTLTSAFMVRQEVAYPPGGFRTNLHLNSPFRCEATPDVIPTPFFDSESGGAYYPADQLGSKNPRTCFFDRQQIPANFLTMARAEANENSWRPHYAGGPNVIFTTSCSLQVLANQIQVLYCIYTNPVLVPPPDSGGGGE